jgi:hypothetical protein
MFYLPLKQDREGQRQFFKQGIKEKKQKLKTKWKKERSRTDGGRDFYRSKGFEFLDRTSVCNHNPITTIRNELNTIITAREGRRREEKKDRSTQRKCP